MACTGRRSRSGSGSKTPRDPKTGKPGKVLFLWAVPAFLATGLGGIPGDAAGHGMDQLAPRPRRALVRERPSAGRSAVPGSWWILGLALTSMIFNYVLGEELLFRGVCCHGWPGSSVVGTGSRTRWPFGLYHVHKIWAWPSMITSAFGVAWAAKRYCSFCMAVIVHGLEGFFIVLIVAVLAGWYP